MTPVVYMAHPVGAEDAAGVDANLSRAVRWYAYLLKAEPDYAITAPWLAALLARIQDDASPADRERGLRDNAAFAARCDGIILCGGRVSDGMRREMHAVICAGGWVADVTDVCGDEPPSEIMEIIAKGRARGASREH